MQPYRDQDSIEDLVDFFNRWPSLRKKALEMRDSAPDASDQKHILTWMILMIDRVGPADLPKYQEQNNVCQSIASHVAPFTSSRMDPPRVWAPRGS